MGKSSKDAAHVFVCSNCGSEFIQWVGRCPTCREYNTIQEMKVGRRSSIGVEGGVGGNGKGSSGRPPRPVFGGGADDLDDYGVGGGFDDDGFVKRKEGHFSNACGEPKSKYILVKQKNKETITASVFRHSLE